MKKTIFESLLFFSLILLVWSCSSRNKVTVTVNNPKNITKVTISTLQGGDASLKSTEERSKIEQVVDYINKLKLKKTTKDGGEYDGLSFKITLYYNDNTSIEYIHDQNMFFKESGKSWYEMNYNQADKFNEIYNNLLR